MKHEKTSKNRSSRASSAPVRMPVIGLAGGIGSGKSLVASQLGQMGCAVIDVDRLAKELRDLPGTREALGQSFGEEIFAKDGKIDEKALSELVFAPSEEQEGSPLARLNAIIHPLVIGEVGRLIEQYRRPPSPKALILDAPLLFEAGLEACCDAVIFVSSEPATRAQRVLEQRGWSERDWARREKTQIPLDKKLDMSDYVVDNDTVEVDLCCHLQRLFSRILGETSTIQRSVESCEPPSKQEDINPDNAVDNRGEDLKNSEDV